MLEVILRAVRCAIRITKINSDTIKNISKNATQCLTTSKLKYYIRSLKINYQNIIDDINSSVHEETFQSFPEFSTFAINQTYFPA